MDFYKTMLLIPAVICIILFDSTHGFLCYNCDATNPNCGKMIGDGSGIPTVECAAESSCLTSKSSVAMEDGIVLDIYSRSCDQNCFDGCQNIERVPSCMSCCKGDRCNGDYVDQAPPPTPVAGLMCYNCTQDNPACGKTLGDASAIQQIPCSGQCMTTKTTSMIQGNTFELYERSCSAFCFEMCQDFPPEAGMEGSVCMYCCSDTTLCNGDLGASTTGTPEPEPNQPSEGGTPESGKNPAVDNEIDNEDAKDADSNNMDGQKTTGTAPSVNDMMTTKSSTVNVAVNVATIILTGIVSTNIF